MTSVEEMLELLDSPAPRPDTTWTTGNVTEAIPGVFSAFGLSFVSVPVELGTVEVIP